VPFGAEKSAVGDPNRQRDETPEARPQRAAMPLAPKARQNATDPRGTGPRVRAEESIPADDQSRGGVSQWAICLLNAAR